MVSRKDTQRRRAWLYRLACILCFCVFSAPAAAQVTWKRVGTVSTLDANQLCKTDGQVIICDTTTPTISSSGQVGIGTATPQSLLSLFGGGLAVGSYAATTAAGTGSIVASGNIGVGTSLPLVTVDLSRRTDALALPVGTTGQEPATPLNGMIRYNTSLTDIEAYIGGYWTTLTTESGGTSSLYLGTSVSVPNLAASATDTQTGFYTAGTGHVDVTSTGTQVVDISTAGMNVVTGNVGIGTTSPAAKLDVNGAIDIKGMNGISFNAADTTLGASIAIGSSALSGQTTSGAYGNTAIGYQALNGALTTHGNEETAVGYQAGTAVTSGGINTLIGYQAGNTINTGYENTIIGAFAETTAGATTNTVIGYGAQANGQNNEVAIGAGAIAGNGGDIVISIYGGRSLGNGFNSVLLGGGPSYVNNGGITIGGTSGNTGITGAANIILGNGTGKTVTSGANNLIIGSGVQTTTLTTGSNNILIGTNSGVDTQSGSSSNTLNIGNLIYGIGLGTSGTTPAGNVGIGTASPYVSLDLHSKTDALALPVGTTGQEPATPLNGMIRYNTSLTDIEAYIGGYWTTLTTESGGTSNIYLGTSAAVPNLSASASDTQTGLYTAGTGHVDMTSNGSQIVDISTSGMNVVTGNVGIGTTSPGGVLDIYNSSGTSLAQIRPNGTSSFGGATNYGALTLIGNASGANAPGMALYNSGGGTGSSVSMDFYTTYANGGVPQARLLGLDDGNFSNNIVFSTKNPGAAGNALTERMRISSSGAVGIGTTSPVYTLDVNGNIGNSTGAIGFYAGGTNQSITFTPSGTGTASFVTNTNANGVAGASFVNNWGTSSGYVVPLAMYAPNLFGGGYVQSILGVSQTANNDVGTSFHYAGSGSAANYYGWNFYGGSIVMSLVANGNVGIGTTAPSNKLDIAGGRSGRRVLCWVKNSPDPWSYSPGQCRHRHDHCANRTDCSHQRIGSGRRDGQRALQCRHGRADAL
jgi:hypothetical protein